MYLLVRNIPSRSFVALEGPSFACALLIAEAWFKFHSFTLEMLAFLTTWTAISWTVHTTMRVARSRKA